MWVVVRFLCLWRLLWALGYSREVLLSVMDGRSDLLDGVILDINEDSVTVCVAACDCS